jgi:transcriptional regulator with XRE-family HTH domain
MKFGEKVKQQRVRRNMTQDELAMALSVSKRTVCYYEDGKTYPQNREIYVRLSNIFEMDINYFLTEDEDFLTEAAEKYGRRGRAQAQAVLDQASALFAGGELSDEDKLAFIHEIQGLYFDSKERAKKKFSPGKQRKEDSVKS